VTIVGAGATHLFGSGSALPAILTFGFAQMIMWGVPLILGLLWNKWAGGAAGFLMGGLYYVASAGYYSFTYASYGTQYIGTQYNFFRDPSMIGYLINGILIGYIAGALVLGSTNFKRMLGAGLTASLTAGFLQYLLNYVFANTPSRNMTTGNPPTIGAGLYSFTLLIAPQIALGILGPIVAKVMTWYGLQPLRHQ
jgi:hypothetical protein